MQQSHRLVIVRLVVKVHKELFERYLIVLQKTADEQHPFTCRLWVELRRLPESRSELLQE